MKTIIVIAYFNIGVDVLGFVKFWVHEHSTNLKDKRKTAGNLYKPKNKLEYTYHVNQFEV